MLGCALLLLALLTHSLSLSHLQIKRVDERLSALGNVIACNDYVAIVHPDLDKVCCFANHILNYLVML